MDTIHSEPGRRGDLRIELVDASKLTPEMKAAILSLCNCAYEEDVEPLFNTFKGATHGIGYLDNSIVCHALWVTRWLQPGHTSPLRTAYIELVATAPAYQRRGYATAVLRQVGKAIADFELGGLSPADPRFYARLGWVLWCGPLSIRSSQGLIPTPDETVMVLPLPKTPALDLDSPLSAEWREGEVW